MKRKDARQLATQSHKFHNGMKQKRLSLYSYGPVVCELLNTHYRQVGVSATDFEPKFRCLAAHGFT